MRSLDRGARLAIPQKHEMPGVGSGALPIGGVGFEQSRQVLLGDEAAGGEEEALRQPQALAPERRIGADALRPESKMQVVHGVVAAEDAARREPQRADIGELGRARDERGVAKPHDQSLDRLPVASAYRVGSGAVRHHHGGAASPQAPQESGQRCRMRPAGNRDDGWIGPGQSVVDPPADLPACGGIRVRMLEQGDSLEATRAGDVRPLIRAIDGGELDRGEGAA
jgi:hypothetical protein